jgi:hypothetical protein
MVAVLTFTAFGGALHASLGDSPAEVARAYSGDELVALDRTRWATRILYRVNKYYALILIQNGKSTSESLITSADVSVEELTAVVKVCKNKYNNGKPWKLVSEAPQVCLFNGDVYMTLERRSGSTLYYQVPRNAWWVAVSYLRPIEADKDTQK